MLLFSKRLLRPGIFYQCLNLYNENNILGCFELYNREESLRQYIETTLNYDIESARIKVQLILYEVELNPSKQNALEISAIALHNNLFYSLRNSLTPNSSDEKYKKFLDIWEERIELIANNFNIIEALNNYILLLTAFFQKYKKITLYDNILANLSDFLDAHYELYCAQHNSKLNKKILKEIISPLIRKLLELQKDSDLPFKTKMEITRITYYISKELDSKNGSGKYKSSRRLSPKN